MRYTLLIGNTWIPSDPLFKHTVNRHANKDYKVNSDTCQFSPFPCSDTKRNIVMWYKQNHSSHSVLAFSSPAAPGKSAPLLSSQGSPGHQTQEAWAWPGKTLCKSRRWKTVRISLLVAALLQSTRNYYSHLLIVRYTPELDPTLRY